MAKVRVDVEDVFQNAEDQRRWNEPKLSEIEFYHLGKKVEVLLDYRKAWDFIGLSNDKFILDYDWPE